MPQIQLRDKFGTPIPLMNIRLGVGIDTVDEAPDDRFTDYAGNTAWPYKPTSPGGFTLFVNYANVNSKYKPTQKHVANLDEDILITVEREPLPKLTLNGKYLNVFIKGNTDFLIYKKFLDGQDITPLLAQRSSLGSNCVRVFGMVDSFSHWHPQDYGDRYYQQIPVFLDLLQDYGMYCYFCVFADTQHIMPSLAQQQDHWAKVIDALSMRVNAIVELVNEPNQHENGVDRTKFFKPQSMISVCGDFGDEYGGDVWPEPQWDLTDYHAPRSLPKNIKDLCSADNPNWVAGKGVMQGEPDKFGRDVYTGRTFRMDPQLAKQMAGSARGTNAGIIFHSTDGVYSDTFSPEVVACAYAWFKELQGA